MRPYCAGRFRLMWICEHGPGVRRRSARGHSRPYDQFMRRYDAGRARQEARQIVREEVALYHQGLRQDAIEQAAHDLMYLITEPAEPYFTFTMEDDALDRAFDRLEEKRWEEERAWEDHEWEETQAAMQLDEQMLYEEW